MSSSSKKITYTSDFKLKVLDYYFKHGGDENFGLKTKTAGHFNIDKKTINRMLNNPEMVKRARRLLAKRHSSSSKPSSSSSSSSSKPSSATSSITSSKSSRSGKHIKSSKVAVAAASGKVTGGSSKSTSVSAASSPAASGGAASGGVAAGTSGASAAAANSSSAASSSSRVRCVGQASAEGVKVLELPEDPDYSLLKRSINASANGVANVAKLLVTGTEEVRKLILNECDIILECKVCQNLFRSIVNFLAHKRIYCQEAFADVRTLFHRDNTQGVTSQSGTVVVEPEEPPPSPPPPPDLQPRPVVPPPPASAREGGRGQGRIDSIADRLAGQQGRGSSSQSSPGNDFASAMSHPTHTGSAKYYERLQMVNAARDKLSQDCSVVLEDIRGVSNARFQTFQPHSPSATNATPLPPMSQLLEEVSQRTSGVSVALGERGEVVKTARGDVEVMDVEKPATSQQGASPGHDLLCRLCNTRFATSKTLSVHQRSHHGLERYVYSCPICKTAFITMWGVVKHLEKVHKKTKHQTDRLKKVIRKNVTKKLFFPTSDLGVEGEGAQAEDGAEGEGQPDHRGEKFHGPVEVTEGQAYERIAEAGGLGVVGSTNRTSVGGAAVSRTSRVSSVSPASTTTTTTSRKSSSSRSSQKRDEGGSVVAPEHRCAKCERRFMTPQALISHKKFCSLQQMKPPQSVLLPKSPLNPCLRSETPEKRIAIQIRKDYKKSLSPACGGDGATDAKDSATQDEVQDIMSDGATASKVEELMNKLCNLSSLTCVPCGRRYQTITTLKRHVSVHFNWTRYACRRCPFRSYNRYELTRHATSQHGVTESAATGLLVEEVAFGPVKYSLTEAEAGEREEGADVTRPPPLHVNSAKVEVNGIRSEAEGKDEGEEGVKEEEVESDKRNSKHINTHTHKPDTPDPPHTHTNTNALPKPKDSEVKSGSALETKASDGTTPQECQTVPEGEKNQQNSSAMPARGEHGGGDILSPHTPPLTADGKAEKTADDQNKEKRSHDTQELSDSSTKTQADSKTVDGRATASKTADKTDGGKAEQIADNTHKQKRNWDQHDSSADSMKSQATSKRRTEQTESSVDSTKSQGSSKKRSASQDSSADSNKTQEQQKSSVDTSKTQGNGTRKNNTEESSADNTNTETASNKNFEPNASPANKKRTSEQLDPSDSMKTQSDPDPKLPATKKSKKKLTKRRRLNNHPPQGSETTHNTCNGTHGDEKTNGSLTPGLTPLSDLPQPKAGGKVHSTAPQPPEDKSKLDGRKVLENNGLEDSGTRGEREQSGTGKDWKRESGIGSGGVQNSVMEGKQGVS